MNRKRHDVVRGFSSKMKMILKESLGFTVLTLLLPCLLRGLQSGCTTHPLTTSARQRLQGTWEGFLVGAEKNGKITMTITGTLAPANRRHACRFQALAYSCGQRLRRGSLSVTLAWNS